MRVILTKNSDEEHGFEVIYDDGSRERIDLVSKSFLMHDFTHYAVESLAKTEAGFWGSLRKAGSLAALNDRKQDMDVALGGETGAIELIAGSISSVVQGRGTAQGVIDGMKNLLTAQGKEVPKWLTLDFVEAVQKRMRELVGKWNSVPYGETMELPWPAA